MCCTNLELPCMPFCWSFKILSCQSNLSLSSLALNNWTRWIQTPLTHSATQPSYLYEMKPCDWLVCPCPHVTTTSHTLSYPMRPSYLHTIVSVHSPRSTHSSSLVTLARPPASSTLRITDRSFRYASPSLWNQLPSSLQPHPSPSISELPFASSTTSPPSVLSPPVTPSRLRTYLFHKSFPP